LAEFCSAVIVAATAELAGLTVLHCDKDFDLIASVTGQPAEWLIATWGPDLGLIAHGTAVRVRTRCCPCCW
jgi:hypothetical protein